jgi:hypothetical protein
MSEKLPYWQHPDYDNSTDPSYIEYELTQFLEPITREHAYCFVQRCICDQKNEEHDLSSVKYNFGVIGTEQFPAYCPQQNFDFGLYSRSFIYFGQLLSLCEIRLKNVNFTIPFFSSLSSIIRLISYESTL